jgi:hypothetical protein
MHLLTAFAERIGENWRVLLQDPEVIEELVLIPDGGIWITAETIELGPDAPPQSADLERRIPPPGPMPPEWKTVDEYVPEELHKQPFSIRHSEGALKGRRCRIQVESFGGGICWKTSEPPWHVDFSPNLSNPAFPPVCLESVLENGPLPGLYYGVRVTFDLRHLWVDFPARVRAELPTTTEQLQSTAASRLPHTCFANYLRPQGLKRAIAWIRFRDLAKESKGEKSVEIPGYGSVFLKLDPKDIKGSVLYSDTNFRSSSDGESISQSKFEDAWKRAPNNQLKGITGG